jgi:hypothetical protein
VLDRRWDRPPYSGVAATLIFGNLGKRRFMQLISGLR